MSAESLVETMWRTAYGFGLVRARMPLWRVVVDARSKDDEETGVVCALRVWAEDAEEAEALAILCVEADGHQPITADATTIAPNRAPSRKAGVVAKSAYSAYGGPLPMSERAT